LSFCTECGTEYDDNVYFCRECRKLLLRIDENDEVIAHIKDSDSEFKITSKNLLVYRKRSNTPQYYFWDKIENLSLKKSEYTADLKFDYLDEQISKPISLKAFQELKEIFKETSTPLIIKKPDKRFFDIYMCPNIDCIYKNNLQKDDKCPICLTPARKMSSLRADNISRIKSKKAEELREKSLNNQNGKNDQLND